MESEKMKKAELIDYAEEKGITIDKKSTKEEIIKAITAAEALEETAESTPEEAPEEITKSSDDQDNTNSFNINENDEIKEFESEVEGKKEGAEDKDKEEVKKSETVPADTFGDFLPEEELSHHIDRSKFRKRQNTIRRGGRIVIDSKDKFKHTQSAQETEDLEIRASLDRNIKKILTGKVVRSTFVVIGGVKHYAAVVSYGHYSIQIPASYFFEDYKEIDPAYIDRLIKYRFGSEVDFVVEKISDEPDTRIALGNRVAAMKMLRKRFWFAKTDMKNKDGTIKDYLRPGLVVQARVVTTVKIGAFVEIFGAETKIPLSELSYIHPDSASSVVKVGEKINVRLMNIKRDQKKNIVSYNASVKRTKADPRAEVFGTFKVGQSCQGTVTRLMKNDKGLSFFVNIGDYDLLCSARKGLQVIPKVGDVVWIDITGLDPETLLVWGNITHIII